MYCHIMGLVKRCQLMGYVVGGCGKVVFDCLCLCFLGGAWVAFYLFFKLLFIIFDFCFHF